MKLSDLGLKQKDIPALFMPYQDNWDSDSSGIKLWTKSRRIGATWGDSAGSSLDAARANGCDTYYIGFDKDMTRGYIEDAAEWAKLYNIAASEIDETEEVFKDGDEEKSIFIYRIYFNSKHRIEALSSCPRVLRSRQGNVVIDEAAFHDDFPGVFEAALPLRILSGKIRIITTYNGIENDYYEFERDVLAGKLPYSRHFTTFDDALEQGWYKRICLIMGQKWSLEGQVEYRDQIMKEHGDRANQELLCIPSRSGGVYFPRVLVESCMVVDIPVLRLECSDNFTLEPDSTREGYIEKWLAQNLAPLLSDLNPNLKSYFGMDFGRSGDLSVIVPLQMLPNLTRRAPFALEMRNVPFRQQEQILFWLVDRLPRFEGGAMDARGNGEHLAEITAQRYNRYGIKRIAEIKFTESWYGENFPKYKAGMEDKKILLPSDDDWLQDHRDIVVSNGIPRVRERRSKGTDGKQRHGDAAIAGVLGWYASCQEYGGNIILPDFGLQNEIILPTQKEVVDFGWFS